MRDPHGGLGLRRQTALESRFGALKSSPLIQSFVDGFINHTHPALTYFPDHPEAVVDQVTGLERALNNGTTHQRIEKKTSHAQFAVDLALQRLQQLRIVAAGAGKECFALVWRKFERGFEQAYESFVASDSVVFH